VEWVATIARHVDELVAAIEDDPDDAENFRVYGDWLERNGDPRGQLIAMQLLLETLTDRSKREHLEERIARYFDRHRAAFAPAIGAALSTRTLLQNWRRGFQHALVVTATAYQPNPDVLLADLLAHPSGRFLVELGLAVQGLHAQAAVDALARATPRALRVLALRVPSADLTALCPQLTRLRTLELHAWQSATVTSTALPALERLTIALPGPATHAVLAGQLPALRELRVFCRDLSPPHLQPLLDLPALAGLTLVDCGFTPELARDLLASPLATRPLERIQLEQCALGSRTMAQLRTVAREVVRT
jgi:uncharacterized protein (TIGR02996 family)